MRIAFVAQPFDKMYPPVEAGSLGIWAYQVAQVCARRGASVVIFANHGDAFSTKTKVHNGIRYIYTRTFVNRIGNRVARAIAQRSRVPMFASRWNEFGYAREVGRRSRELSCDVVLIMNYSQFAPVIHSMSPKSKICLSMHCEWLTQLDSQVVASRLRATDLIVGCSEYITHSIVKAYPTFADRCVTVPNATSVSQESELAEPRPTSEVLFVGRVSPEKGVHDLITAFHKVLARFPWARLRIVGYLGSAPREFLVELSTESNIRNLQKFYEGLTQNGKDPYLVHLEHLAGPELGTRIFFEGEVDHSRTTTYYRNAALLVNPSLSESFGMTLVEAMMQGLPVVATRVGGMPFIVENGRTGYLVEPANTEELAAAICRTLEHPCKAREMGEAGRTAVLHKYTWDSVADSLLNQLHRLLQ